MIAAAIDLGSNTVKMTVARRVGEDLMVIAERADITRIGEGLDKTGRLDDAAMDRTFAKLEAYVALARASSAEKIACVATAGMRGAANAHVFIERVKAHLGLEIEIIHGLREAELAFVPSARAYGPGPVAVVDVGGRSTELILGTAAGISERVSLEIGGVRLTERFLHHDPPQAEELEACRRFIAETFAGAPATGGARLVGVSGTVVSLWGRHHELAVMDEVVRQGEGASLARADVEALVAALARLPAEQRLYGDVIGRGRHDVIVAGGLVVLGALDHAGASELYVSNRGVRYGLLYELT